MDIDNDELMEGIPDVLVDYGKSHIGDLDMQPINEDEVTPEEYWESRSARRSLTVEVPKLVGTGGMYEILASMRDAYRKLRTMCINNKHTEYIDVLDLLDLAIQEWVVECNSVEEKTRKGEVGKEETRRGDVLV